MNDTSFFKSDLDILALLFRNETKTIDTKGFNVGFCFSSGFKTPKKEIRTAPNGTTSIPIVYVLL